MVCVGGELGWEVAMFKAPVSCIIVVTRVVADGAALLLLFDYAPNGNNHQDQGALNWVTQQYK